MTVEVAFPVLFPTRFVSRDEVNLSYHRYDNGYWNAGVGYERDMESGRGIDYAVNGLSVVCGYICW